MPGAGNSGVIHEQPAGGLGRCTHMKRLLLLAIVAFVLAVPAAPVSAGTCLSDLTPAWGSFTTTDLCTP